LEDDVSQENKDVMVRLVDELFNKRNLDIFDEVVADTYIYHGKGFQGGREGLKTGMMKWFDEMSFTSAVVEDVFGEGSKVALRFALTATYRSDLSDVRAGRTFTNHAIETHRFAGGLLTESWVGSADELGVMAASGLLPVELVDKLAQFAR